MYCGKALAVWGGGGGGGVSGPININILIIQYSNNNVSIRDFLQGVELEKTTMYTKYKNIIQFYLRFNTVLVQNIVIQYNFKIKNKFI